MTKTLLRGLAALFALVLAAPVTACPCIPQEDMKQGAPDEARDKKDKEKQKAIDKQNDKQKDKDEAKRHKAVINKMMAEVKKHEVRTARIVKLQEVFAEKGNDVRVAELDKMLAEEQARHTQAMTGYRAELGPELAAKVEGPIAEMQGKRGKARAMARKQLKDSVRGKGKGKGKGTDKDKSKDKGKNGGQGQGKGKGAQR